jgi:hypothetical protein
MDHQCCHLRYNGNLPTQNGEARSRDRAAHARCRITKAADTALPRIDGGLCCGSVTLMTERQIVDILTAGEASRSAAVVTWVKTQGGYSCCLPRLA